MTQKMTSPTLPTVDWNHPPADFTFILFERVNVAENAQRFYYLGWLPTLLHPRAVVRIYGRKGQTQHVVTPQPFASLEEAWPLLRRIIKTRLRHGYRVVQPADYQ